MTTSNRESSVMTRRLPLLLVALALLAAAAAGCGKKERGSSRGCVIVDVSGSARGEITGRYLPGFENFVQRISSEGSGDVCFAFAAAGITGGGAAWANFACTNPDDRVRCAPEMRQKVTAAAAQLAGVAAGPNALHGASELVEGIAVTANTTEPGDEILLLSDAIQNSSLTGDFTVRATRLDDAGIEAILRRLRERNLLPDLSRRKLLIPYALAHAKPLNMSASRQQAVRAFWERYAAATRAELTFGGGDEAA
jgi:hypothetical protein